MYALKNRFLFDKNQINNQLIIGQFSHEIFTAEYE